MHHATSGSHGIRRERRRVGPREDVLEAVLEARDDVVGRSTVMIASQWAAPSATRWSKNATG